MEELQNIINIIYDEKENMKDINFLNINEFEKCGNENIQTIIKIMKDLDFKYEKIIKKKMNEMKNKLTNEEIRIYYQRILIKQD